MSDIAYQLWYEFLKRSKKYEECCADGGAGELSLLYEDFGDVHAVTWRKWWQSKKDLFTDIEAEFVVNEIKTYAEFRLLFEEEEDDLLGLVINLNSPKSLILKRVSALLTRLKGGLFEKENMQKEDEKSRTNPKNDKEKEKLPLKKKQRRPKFTNELNHRYGLASAPSSRDIEALEMMLKVYDACLQEDAKTKGARRKKRYEIGERLGIVLTPRGETLDDEEDNEESYRNKMTATVCRYNRWATEIIKNTERGIFPKHS